MCGYAEGVWRGSVVVVDMERAVYDRGGGDWRSVGGCAGERGGASGQ